MLRTHIALIVSVVLVGSIHSAPHYHLSQFATGTALARFQDFLFANPPDDSLHSRKALTSLRNNHWVKMAAGRCPSNLVIRHWVLIDLHSQTPAHAERILTMMHTLIWNDTASALWAEGYSYWEYTRPFLVKWASRFSTQTDVAGIAALIKAIDEGFVATAYVRSGLLYPAPFGDLRDHPLNDRLQTEIRGIHESDTLVYGRLRRIVRDDTTDYEISGHALGMNTHVPLETSAVRIIHGTPQNFRYYTGYEAKYTSTVAEWRDILDRRRRNSVREIRSGKKTEPELPE